MITARFIPNTQFFLTQIDIKTNSVTNTPLKYEIKYNDTVLARFTTRQEMNDALSKFAEEMENILKNQPPPPPQMILTINQHTKIPVATTGNTKHIDGELHYEVIINNNQHYVNTKQLTDTQ